MALKTTQEKYLHELGDIYDAENRFLKGQQAMLKAATDATLKAGIEQHIAESEQQVVSLIMVFGLCANLSDEDPRGYCGMTAISRQGG